MEVASRHAGDEAQDVLKQLITKDLAVRVGFEPKGPIENTQVIDSTSSQNA
jgi:hypothetical protein